ncbi:Hypothetical predicted protein, partial [Xyrichtys novacula]
MLTYETVHTARARKRRARNGSRSGARLLRFSLFLARAARADVKLNRADRTRQEVRKEMRENP